MLGSRDKRALRVMREYKIGVRPLGEGWWPDFSQAKLTPAQQVEIQASLQEEDPFDDPVEAVFFVASLLGLANFP